MHTSQVLAEKGGFLAADPHRVKCESDGASGEWDGVWVKSLQAVRASAEPHAKQRRGSGRDREQPPPPPQSAECEQLSLAAAVTERLAELQASDRLSSQSHVCLSVLRRGADLCLTPTVTLECG